MNTQTGVTGRICGIATVLTLAFASASQAQVIVDVQFNGFPGEDNNYSGAAMVGAAGDYWNNLGPNGAGVALNDPANAASGLSLTWTSNGGATVAEAFVGNGFYSTSYRNLMEGYIYKPTPGTAQITLSGLAPSTDYSLYLYSEGDSGSTGRRLGVSVNGGATTTTSAAVASAGTFIEGQNYLKLNAASDVTGKLDIAYSFAVGEANINGFQVSAVPEPASTMLAMEALLGGLALWRRSKS
jgi:hypothetical protein